MRLLPVSRPLPMSRLLALPALGASALCGAQVPVDRANLVSLSASVLKVEARRAEGGFGLGSGVAIARDRVVTNCHVTRDAVRVQVQRGGVRWTADAEHRVPEQDLCVLRVPALQAEPVALASTSRLVPGEPVVALGYTGGAGLQVSDGEVIALHRHHGSWVIQSSNWFNSGASGGGLFNAQRELVGVLTFRLRGADGHYYAAPADWVEAVTTSADRTDFQPIGPHAATTPAYWEPGFNPTPRFLQASALEQTGQWERLASLARQWLNDTPDDPEPWYLLGLAHERDDRLDDAEHALQRSVSLQPQGWTAWHRLGLVQIRQGRLDAARLTLDRLRQQPGPRSQALQAVLDLACASRGATAPDPSPAQPDSPTAPTGRSASPSTAACPAPA